MKPANRAKLVLVLPGTSAGGPHLSWGSRVGAPLSLGTRAGTARKLRYSGRWKALAQFIRT
jgi:hypothetical protein